MDIFIAILGFLSAPIKWLYRKYKPLAVKPSKKKIFFSKNGDNWDEHFFIYLMNYTKNSYYDINILSCCPKDTEVNLSPVTSPNPTLIGNKDAGYLIGLNFAISGQAKEEGENFTQLVINNIEPEGKIKIKVNIKKKNYTKNFTIQFKINNFSKIPKPILTR